MSAAVYSERVYRAIVRSVGADHPRAIRYRRALDQQIARSTRAPPRAPPRASPRAPPSPPPSPKKEEPEPEPEPSDTRITSTVIVFTEADQVGMTEEEFIEAHGRAPRQIRQRRNVIVPTQSGTIFGMPAERPQSEIDMIESNHEAFFERLRAEEEQRRQNMRDAPHREIITLRRLIYRRGFNRFIPSLSVDALNYLHRRRAKKFGPDRKVVR